MKSLTSLALLWLCASCLHAQGTIHKMEYWIDTDPGFGFATNIGGFVSATDVAHSFAIPVSGSIPTGLHTMGLRSRDNSGRWSHTNVFPAFVFKPLSTASIDKIEYWIDSDAGINIATPVTGFASGTDVNYLFMMPANLSVGLHTIGIRSRNTDGKWSHTNHFPVYVSDSVRGVLTEVEIFWELETDPGFGAAHKTIFSAPLNHEFENIILATTPPNLTLGTHNLYVRSKGTRGNWSHTNYFLVQVDSVVSAEDLQLQTGIKVFPNPFVDEITISPPDDGKLRVVIYDQSGRLMGDVLVQGETTLDMSQLNSGTYSAFFWKGGATICKMQLLKI